jgi:hypothetical protein
VEKGKKRQKEEKRKEIRRNKETRGVQETIRDIERRINRVKRKGWERERAKQRSGGKK